MSELEILELAMSGAPIEFSIGDAQFALRQPTPVQLDMIREAQLLAQDRVTRDWRREGLDAEPMSDELRVSIVIERARLEAAYKQAGEDGNEAAKVDAAEQLESLDKFGGITLLTERVNEATKRAGGRWIVAHLVDGDRAEFDRLTRPDPLKRLEVSQAVERLWEVINHDPNSNGRQQ